MLVALTANAQLRQQPFQTLQPCRGVAVAAAAVVVLDWTRSRLALIRRTNGSSDIGLARISASNNFPQVVLLIVGSATCAAHIALGIVEDHARVFHSEDI